MWNERYAQDDYAYGTAPNDFLVEQADRLPQGPVLCLAEGEGRNAVWLAERGHAVTAMDASVVGLEKAHRLAAERGVRIETRCSDLAHFETAPNAWSGIVSIFAHVPPDLRRALHGRVVAGLRPGGVLILEAYTPEQLRLGTGGPPAAELTMDLATLEGELARLVFEVAGEREREVFEGRYPRGRGHVVQIVGRKPLDDRSRRQGVRPRSPEGAAWPTATYARSVPAPAFKGLPQHGSAPAHELLGAPLRQPEDQVAALAESRDGGEARQAQGLIQALARSQVPLCGERVLRHPDAPPGEGDQAAAGRREAFDAQGALGRLRTAGPCGRRTRQPTQARRPR